jgi:hypothetical protein
MKKIARYGRCAAAGLLALLSPAILVLGVPFGYGIVCDIVASRWLAPAAAVAAVGIALGAWRRRVVYAAAAKSMT